MIKMLLLLNFVGSICIHAYPSEIGLDFIRTNYGKVVSNKSLCKKMIDEMEGSNLSSLKLAYLLPWFVAHEPYKLFCYPSNTSYRLFKKPKSSLPVS